MRSTITRGHLYHRHDDSHRVHRGMLSSEISRVPSREVSVLGLVLLVTAVLFGRVVGQSPMPGCFEFEKPALVWLLAGYGFVARSCRGCCRQAISTFAAKLGVVFLLGLGVILMAPTIWMPRLTAFCQWWGPIIPGTFFLLFITIACGAVSDGHSLVFSGNDPR